MRRSSLTVVVIVQQRGGGRGVRNRPASMPTCDVGERQGAGGGGRRGRRSGTGDCPATGTWADGRGRVTARCGQGSGYAAGDPAARPRGSPPTGPASRPLRNRRAPASSRRRRCQRQGSCWMDADGPGRTGPRAQGRGSRRPGVW